MKIEWIDTSNVESKFPIKFYVPSFKMKENGYLLREEGGLIRIIHTRRQGAEYGMLEALRLLEKRGVLEVLEIEWRIDCWSLTCKHKGHKDVSPEKVRVRVARSSYSRG